MSATSYDLIQGQGQGHGGPNVAKMANYEVYLLHQYACNQATGELWSPRQRLNFCSHRFLIFFFLRRHMTFKLRMFHLWQTNFAFQELSTGMPVRG